MIHKYLDRVKECVLSSLVEENISIALFGSTATGAATYASDIDIAVIPKGSWNRCKLTELREALDALNIPYNIDIVDFSKVSETFKKTAGDDAVPALEIIDDRNLTAPTYHEETAISLHQRLPKYAELMKKILQNVQAALLTR